MTTKKELTKVEKISKEKRRIKRIFRDIEENKLKIVEGLFDEASFMRVTLIELKAGINDDGVTDVLQQGDYKVLREHPNVKIYHTMVQRYTTIIKQLTSLLPGESQKNINDGFEDFIHHRL